MNIICCKCGEKIRDFAPLVLRIAVGVIFLVHGYAKISNIGQFSGFLTSLSVPLPMFFAVVVTIVEFFGGIALIIGLFTHWIVKFLAFDMIFAMFLVHIKNGFLITNGGVEFTLILFAASLSLIASGSGKFSLDNSLFNKKQI